MFLDFLIYLRFLNKNLKKRLKSHTLYLFSEPGSVVSFNCWLIGLVVLGEGTLFLDLKFHTIIFEGITRVFYSFDGTF